MKLNLINTTTATLLFFFLLSFCSICGIIIININVVLTCSHVVVLVRTLAFQCNAMSNRHFCHRVGSDGRLNGTWNVIWNVSVTLNRLGCLLNGDVGYFLPPAKSNGFCHSVIHAYGSDVGVNVNDLCKTMKNYDYLLKKKNMKYIFCCSTN